MPFLTRTYHDNITGWGALLGSSAATGEVSPYAAPARAANLCGLPDTYIDVGDLDIFRDEDLSYARRLSDAGVPTELHVHPGGMHVFEALAVAQMYHREQSPTGYVAWGLSEHRKSCHFSWRPNTIRK
ncbi:alpha/beta hydrolase fold domain-containing protein [Mycobacterium sp. URHB0021]